MQDESLAPAKEINANASPPPIWGYDLSQKSPNFVVIKRLHQFIFTMLMPIICFIAGLLILFFTIPFWKALSEPLPTGFTRTNLVLYLLGYGLISIALILGIVGYLAHLNGEILRPVRLATGLIGLIILSYQFIEVNARL